MAWTHKKIKDIRVIFNITDDKGIKNTYTQEEIKKNTIGLNLIKDMQQECIRFALQNFQKD